MAMSAGLLRARGGARCGDAGVGVGGTGGASTTGSAHCGLVRRARPRDDVAVTAQSLVTMPHARAECRLRCGGAVSARYASRIEVWRWLDLTSRRARRVGAGAVAELADRRHRNPEKRAENAAPPVRFVGGVETHTRNCRVRVRVDRGHVGVPMEKVTSSRRRNRHPRQGKKPLRGRG